MGALLIGGAVYGAFLLGTLRLLFCRETLALGPSGLLFGLEPGLLGASTARRRLIAVRGSRDATLVELLGALAPICDRGDEKNERHSDDGDDDDGRGGYEERHVWILSSPRHVRGTAPRGVSG